MKLSIITINLNNINGLVKTIKSVESQTMTEFEWIVIDGGSTDGSEEFIESHSNRMSYWISESDKGIYNAMNKGIKIANGEYVLFLNSGDCLISSDILNMVFKKNRTEDYLFGQAVYVNENDSDLIVGFNRNNFSAFSLLSDSLPHQSCFIKRDLFQRFGYYDETYKIISDLKFAYIAIVCNNCSVSYLDMIVSVCEPNGISGDVKECEKEKERFFLELYSPRLLIDYIEFDKLNNSYSYYHYKANKDRYDKSLLIYDFFRKTWLTRKFQTLLVKFVMLIKKNFYCL